MLFVKMLKKVSKNIDQTDKSQNMTFEDDNRAAKL